MQFLIRIGLISFFAFGPGIGWVAATSPQFSISFHSESIVVGTQISLGEIAKIATSNEKIGHALRKLQITEAAPPGETRELTLSFIRKCIKERGFNLRQIQFTGPKILRITTMPTKIIDLLIEDKIALRYRTFQIIKWDQNFTFHKNKSITGCIRQVS